MPPQTIQIALGIAFLILSLGVHEAAHAYVADRCGDGTAREEGRLTLNPMAHIDPFMTIILPLILFMTSGFIFGGARPVPVNPMRLRHPLRDMSFVALAGPASNLVLALVLLEWFQRHLHHPLQVLHWPKPLRWAVYTATFWFVAEYAGRLPDNPFIYFQF